MVRQRWRSQSQALLPLPSLYTCPADRPAAGKDVGIAQTRHGDIRNQPNQLQSQSGESSLSQLGRRRSSSTCRTPPPSAAAAVAVTGRPLQAVCQVKVCTAREPLDAHHAPCTSLARVQLVSSSRPAPAAVGSQRQPSETAIAVGEAPVQNCCRWLLQDWAQAAGMTRV